MLKFSSSTATLKFRGKFKAPFKLDCSFYNVICKTNSKKGHAPPLKPIIIVPPFFGKEMTFYNDPFLKIKLFFFGDFNRFFPHTILALTLIGKEGIGGQKHTRDKLQNRPLSSNSEYSNRFVIDNIICNFSNNIVYDGKYITLPNLKVVDLADIPPLDLDSNSTITISLQTPFITRNFPPSLPELLNKIKHRLIFLVNEYGSGERIGDFSVDSELIEFSHHFHKLYRKSSRSSKDRFMGYTGKLSYKLHKIDQNAKWLLNIGSLIGAGKDLSFGLGMLDIEINS